MPKAKPTVPDAQRYLSIAETALTLGASTKFVIREMLEGKFGREVIDLGNGKSWRGHAYRIPKTAVDAYVASRRIFTEEQAA